jgi:hypothetical protein
MVKYTLKNIRWLRIIGSAFAVIALSFLVVIVTTFGYAFILAFEVRGRPDQAAISHFATTISPKLMPLLEIFLTFFVTIVVTKKIQKNIFIHSLIIGIFTALLSAAIKLSFGGQLNYLNIIFFLIIVGSGFLGGIVCQKRIDKKMKSPA